MVASETLERLVDDRRHTGAAARALENNSQQETPRAFKAALSAAAAMGRGSDSELVHVNPSEMRMLKRMGGSGKINPHTGLREFDGNGAAGGNDDGTNVANMYDWYDFVAKLHNPSGLVWNNDMPVIKQEGDGVIRTLTQQEVFDDQWRYFIDEGMATVDLGPEALDIWKRLSAGLPAFGNLGKAGPMAYKTAANPALQNQIYGDYFSGPTSMMPMDSLESNALVIGGHDQAAAAPTATQAAAEPSIGASTPVAIATAAPARGVSQIAATLPDIGAARSLAAQQREAAVSTAGNPAEGPAASEAWARSQQRGSVAGGIADASDLVNNSPLLQLNQAGGSRRYGA